MLAIELPAPIRVPVTLGPNVRGMSACAQYGALSSQKTGALNVSGTTASTPISGGNWNTSPAGFNANLSKSIYKDNVTTVQPASG